MISDIGRCDSRETLPLIAESRALLFRIVIRPAARPSTSKVALALHAERSSTDTVTQEARDVVAALSDAPGCDGQADAQRQERQ